MGLSKSMERVVASCVKQCEVSLGIHKELSKFRMEHLDGFVHIQSLQSHLRRDLAELRIQLSDTDERKQGGSPLAWDREGRVWEVVKKNISMPEGARFVPDPACSQSPSELTTGCASELCEANSGFAPDSPSFGLERIALDGIGHTNGSSETSAPSQAGGSNIIAADGVAPDLCECTHGSTPPTHAVTQSGDVSIADRFASLGSQPTGPVRDLPHLR